MAGEAAVMQIDKSDLVVVAAAVLALAIFALSIYWLLSAPLGANFQKDQFEAYKAIFGLVVHDTLLALFTAIVGLKVGFVAARALVMRLGRPD